MEIKIDKYEYERICNEIEKELPELDWAEASLKSKRLVDIVLDCLEIRR